MDSYTLHITLYDLFFFGMIFIGLNFVLLLAFVKSINRGANRFLALALLTMIAWMIRILAIDIRLDASLPPQFLLATGPLMCFYVLKLTRSAYQFRWKDLLHFGPLVLERVAAFAAPVFQQFNLVLQVLIFISVITYLYWSHQLIQNFYRRLHPVLMDRSILEFRWLRRLLGATALLWMLWIIYATVDYFGYRSQLGIHGYYPFYIFFAVIIIWTAMAAFLRPQTATLAHPAPVLKPSLPAELREKGAWLKKQMDANKYY